MRIRRLPLLLLLTCIRSFFEKQLEIWRLTNLVDGSIENNFHSICVRCFNLQQTHFCRLFCQHIATNSIGSGSIRPTEAVTLKRINIIRILIAASASDNFRQLTRMNSKLRLEQKFCDADRYSKNSEVRIAVLMLANNITVDWRGRASSGLFFAHLHQYIALIVLLSFSHLAILY